MKNPLPLYVGTGLLVALSAVCAVCIVLSLFIGLLNLDPSTNQATPQLAQAQPAAPVAPGEAPAIPVAPSIDSSVPVAPPPPDVEVPQVEIPDPSVEQPQVPQPVATPVPVEQPSEEAVIIDESDEDDEEPAVIIEEEGAAEAQAEEAPAPPPTAVFEEARLVISNIDRVAEFVDVKNIGGTAQPLDGWEVLSENGGESCLLEGVLPEGGTLRIWSRSADAAQGGFNCGYDSGIWEDQAEDAAILYNAAGQMVYQRR